MRTMLFFDLPTEKKSQRYEYQKFVRQIKKYGFVMMQESVYVKFDLDQRAADSTYKEVKKIVPNEGSVALLCVTEKQFASIKFIIGEFESDIITSDERNIEL